MARAEAYLHAKFHLDPTNRLATIRQRYRQTGRQTAQTDRQRSHGIGRTFLQTVAQKNDITSTRRSNGMSKSSEDIRIGIEYRQRTARRRRVRQTVPCPSCGQVKDAITDDGQMRLWHDVDAERRRRRASRSETRRSSLMRYSGKRVPGFCTQFAAPSSASATGEGVASRGKQYGDTHGQLSSPCLANN